MKLLFDLNGGLVDMELRIFQKVDHPILKNLLKSFEERVLLKCLECHDLFGLVPESLVEKGFTS